MRLRASTRRSSASPPSRSGRICSSLVALGLACYGVFCFFDARYHRV